jgi:tRNA-dihydrouridine synthase
VSTAATFDDDTPTAIQIYGSDPARLSRPRRGRAASPSFVDIVGPKIAGRGAGAGWLRDPLKMVEMAKLIVSTISLPVTIKTRIGYGPESEMPIVDLARRLEDVGVRALTIHCRTAQMGTRARPVRAAKAKSVVSSRSSNGDIMAEDEARVRDRLRGVMVGRAAIDHRGCSASAQPARSGHRRSWPTAADRLSSAASTCSRT